MKITIIEKVEKEVKYLEAKCGARYWEDAEVNGVDDVDGNLIPMRKGDYWSPVIELETGVIQHWPNGTTAKVHYKVCDNGTYNLLDENMNKVSSFEGYVPTMMCPRSNGYGDYVIMDINKEGKIDKWVVDFEEFSNQEDEY